MSAPLVIIKRPFTNSTTRKVKRLQLFKKFLYKFQRQYLMLTTAYSGINIYLAIQSI